MPKAPAARWSIDLLHALHLGKMIARSERARLGKAALPGAVAHECRVGAGQHAAVLDCHRVLGPAEPPADRPRDSPGHEGVDFAAVEVNVPAAARPGRDAAREFMHQRRHGLPVFGEGEIGAQEPYAAGDIVSDTARRDDPVFRVEGGHSADGKTVAPMDVRHRQ